MLLIHLELPLCVHASPNLIIDQTSPATIAINPYLSFAKTNTPLTRIDSLTFEKLTLHSTQLVRPSMGWIKLVIENKTQHAKVFRLSNGMNEFFVQRIIHKNLTLQNEIEHLPIKFLKASDQIRFPANSQNEIYFYIKNDREFAQTFLLISEFEFMAFLNQNFVVLGIIVGFPCGLFVLNLFLLLTTRAPHHGAYCIFLLPIILMGPIYQFDPLPQIPELYSASLFLSLVTGTYFTMVFLRTKQLMPKIHRWGQFNFMMLIAHMIGVFMITRLLPDYIYTFYAISSLFVLSTLLQFIASGCTAHYLGNTMAKWFVLAWSALILGSITGMFGEFSVAPGYIYAMGSTLEMSLLGFVLAEVIHQKRSSLLNEQIKFRFTQNRLNETHRYLENLISKRTDRLVQEKSKLAETITELKSTQKILIEKQKMAELGKLLSMMAIKLKSPTAHSQLLAARSLGYLYQMEVAFKEKRLSKSEFQQILIDVSVRIEALTSAINHAINMVDAFKQIAIVESEETAYFSLNDYVEKLIQQKASEFTKVEFFVHVREEIMMRCSKNTINQIITRLIDNAIEHAFNEIAKPQVHLLISTDADRIVLQVEDNGIGLAHPQHPLIFDAFYKVAANSQAAGLGLCVVKNLVIHRLKGSIRSEQSRQGGLSVVMDFPQQWAS